MPATNIPINGLFRGKARAARACLFGPASTIAPEGIHQGEQHRQACGTGCICLWEDHDRAVSGHVVENYAASGGGRVPAKKTELCQGDVIGVGQGRKIESVCDDSRRWGEVESGVGGGRAV